MAIAHETATKKFKQQTIKTSSYGSNWEINHSQCSSDIRYYTMCFTCIYPHFTDEQTEAQKGFYAKVILKLVTYPTLSITTYCP